MRSNYIDLRLRFSKTQIFAGVVFCLSACLWTNLGSEVITLRTYYPSPYGSYSKFKITDSLSAGTAAKPLAINGNVVQNGNFTLTPQSCAVIPTPSDGQICVDGSDSNTVKVYKKSDAAWHSVSGDSLIGDPVVNYYSASKASWTASFDIPIGADYVFIDIHGTELKSGFFTDEPTFSGNLYINLSTDKTTGYLSYIEGMDDSENFVWVWHSRSYNAGSTTLDGEKVCSFYSDVLKINRVANTLILTMPASYNPNVPDFPFTFSARFYRRG
ncbi:MAG: hypothetical protein WCS77_08105 [Elusimicrobiaceae bacterium]